MRFFTLWKHFSSFLRKNKKKISSSKYDQSLLEMSGNIFPESSTFQEEALEMARQALATRRLSFEEDESCSVLSMVGFPFKDCLLLAVETQNPKLDFLHSMEQMINVYGGQSGEMMDWGFMEELLTWFLKINNMNNQHFIIDAFLDLCLVCKLWNNELHDEIVNVVLEELDADYCGGAINFPMSKKGKHFKEEYSCKIM